MKKKTNLDKRKLLLTIVVSVFALALMIAVLYAFSDSINRNQVTQGQERLREITTQSSAFVHLIVSQEIHKMDVVAKKLSELDQLKSEEANNLLKNFWVGSNFDRMAIDFTSGVSYTTDGYTVDISGMEYVQQIDKGKAFITDLIAAKIDGRPCVSIVSPIIKNGKVVAAARGTIYTENFGKILDVKIFSGNGYYHLINSKGQYLTASENSNALLMTENYFDAITKLTYDEGYSAEKINADMQSGLSGTSAYSYGGSDRYVEYMPVGISDWYLVVMVPKEVIDSNANTVQTDMYYLTAIFSTIYLAVFIFYLLMMKRSSDKIKK